MKTALLILALSALPHPQSAVAGGRDTCPKLHVSCCDDPVRWAARHDAADAGFAITSKDGRSNLLIDHGVVAVQLSDRAFREMRREMRKERDSDEDNALARAIQTAVMSGVESMLDHSAECRTRDLRSVSYDGDRLIFITEDGDRVFDGIEIDEEDLAGSFSERDARAFVREFRRVKGRR